MKYDVGLYLLKTKDWTSPEDEVIKGKEYLVSVKTLTEDEKTSIREDNFTHLIDGTFMWFNKHGNFPQAKLLKVIKVATENIESLYLLDGATKVTWNFSEEDGFTYKF